MFEATNSVLNSGESIPQTFLTNPSKLTPVF
jgi:hypothetical protein